MSDNYDNRKKL